MALLGTSHGVGARRVGASVALALVGALGWLLAMPAAALADSTQSSNWAGYAVHRRGVTFTQVAAQWTQPTVSCVPGPPSYSSIWVGIGGYSESSRALEQIGTEADCSTGGVEQSSAWLELVPAPSETISLPVAPGDGVRATVTLAGHEVSFELQDLTTGRSFTRRMRARLIDATSAEWIVEAPSICSGRSCQTLPLANFGSTGFAFATATAAQGVSGTVQSPDWRATRITLVEDAQRLGGADRTAGPVSAVPGPLAYNGSLFPVTFAGAGAAAADHIAGGEIFH